jgi:hypothetical protein
MNQKRASYAYIVNDSFHRVWLFRKKAAADQFAASRSERSRQNGSSNHYDVLELPYSDGAEAGLLEAVRA